MNLGKLGDGTFLGPFLSKASETMKNGISDAIPMQKNEKMLEKIAGKVENGIGNDKKQDFRCKPENMNGGSTMKIWAHRGCSQMYPENTLTSFEKAAKIPGLEGIELDIQFSSDGHMVVIHDERVDRTTNSTGFVRDYSLKELQALEIASLNGETEHIPTINEVLDLLGPYMRKGLKLNIELKTSVYPYVGIEKKIVELVKERGLADHIVWSSFSALSLPIIRELLPDADIGMLAERASDCMRIHKAGIGSNALHPYARAMDLSKEELEGMTVRAWFLKHLYPEKPTGNRLDLKALEAQGITDVFLNEPEVYL